MRSRWILLLFGVVLCAWWFLQPRSTPEELVLSRTAGPEVEAEVQARSEGKAEVQSSSPELVEHSASAIMPVVAEPIPFDPALWPPLPDETVTIKDAFPELRERADRGDQGAACWLGVELLRCREILDDQAAESRRSDGTWQTARSIPHKPQTLEGLRRTERRLELAQRCQGVSPDMTNAGIDWLFGSAKSGSAGALALMSVHSPVSATQYPDGAQLRRALDAQEEMLVMGIRVGSTRALHELTLKAASDWNWGRIRSPNVPKMARSDRAALALFVEMLETRIRSNDSHVLPVVRPGLEMPMVDSSDVPPAVRDHVARLVDEVFAEGWANRDEAPLAGFDDVETDKACTRFIAPRASEASVTAWLKP